MLVTTKLHIRSTDWLSKVYCIENSKSLDLFVSMHVREKVLREYDFDVIIQRVIESGIINYWQSSMHQGKKFTPGAIVKSPLTCEHLSGGFVLLFIGIGLSCVSFFLERLIHSKINSPKLNDEDRKNWIMASKAIDCERHVCIFN